MRFAFDSGLPGMRSRVRLREFAVAARKGRPSYHRTVREIFPAEANDNAIIGAVGTQVVGIVVAYVYAESHPRLSAPASISRNHTFLELTYNCRIWELSWRLPAWQNELDSRGRKRASS